MRTLQNTTSTSGSCISRFEDPILGDGGLCVCWCFGPYKERLLEFPDQRSKALVLLQGAPAVLFRPGLRAHGVRSLVYLRAPLMILIDPLLKARAICQISRRKVWEHSRVNATPMHMHMYTYFLRVLGLGLKVKGFAFSVSIFW